MSSQITRPLYSLRSKISKRKWRVFLNERPILFLTLIFFFSLILSRSRRSPEMARIGYFIQASNSTIYHIQRLVDSVYDPENTYVVHFDEKIPTELRRSCFKNAKRNRPNIHILHPETVTYGGVSLLANTLNGLQALQNYEWDYFINLSGSDYPLISQRRLRSILGSREILGARLNLVQLYLYKREEFEKTIQDRFGTVHLDPSLIRSRSKTADALDADFTGNPYPSDPIQKKAEVLRTDSMNPDITNGLVKPNFIKSEGWTILHREFSEYCTSSADARIQLLAMANSFASDEHFFATVLRRSKYSATFLPDAMRLVVWCNLGEPCAHPKFLDDMDKRKVTRIIARSGAFFARKMNTPNNHLMDFVDRIVKGTHGLSRFEQRLEKTLKLQQVKRLRIGLRNRRKLKILKLTKYFDYQLTFKLSSIVRS